MRHFLYIVIPEKILTEDSKEAYREFAGDNEPADSYFLTGFKSGCVSEFTVDEKELTLTYEEEEGLFFSLTLPFEMIFAALVQRGNIKKFEDELDQLYLRGKEFLHEIQKQQEG